MNTTTATVETRTAEVRVVDAGQQTSQRMMDAIRES
jgi:hypothetical protein